MLYILFVVCVSSGFGSPTKSSDVVSNTCVKEGGCDSCSQKWKDLFEEYFERRCREHHVDLIYRDYVLHLIDAFVYKVWVSSVVRVFRVTRDANCSDMDGSVVDMLARIQYLNNNGRKRMNTCQMFKNMPQFACQPLREHQPSGWWFSRTTFTTEYVLLCAFTGVSGFPMPNDKWERLKECRKDWTKCGY